MEKNWKETYARRRRAFMLVLHKGSAGFAQSHAANMSAITYPTKETDK
jgi:hypothetical protein